MNTKIKKEFCLVVGTNEIGITEEDINEKVAMLESYGNTNLSLRFHIKEIENNIEK